MARSPIVLTALFCVGCLPQVGGNATPPDGTPPEGTRCSPWFPVDLVRSEVWETTSDNETAEGGFTREWLGEVEDRPGVYRTESTIEYFFFTSESVHESETWQEYSCDETGVYYEGLGGRFRIDGGPWTTYEEVPQSRMLAVPNDLGDGWDAVWDTVRNDDSGGAPRSWVTTHEVLGPDTVDTPAGTFDTMRIRSRINEDTPWTRYHLAEDIGWVQFESNTHVVER